MIFFVSYGDKTLKQFGKLLLRKLFCLEAYRNVQRIETSYWRVHFSFCGIILTYERTLIFTVHSL